MRLKGFTEGRLHERRSLGSVFSNLSTATRGNRAESASPRGNFQAHASGYSIKYTLLHEVGDAAKQADEKVKSAVEVIAENGSHHYGVCHMRDVLSAKEALAS